jgi:hypothetical protein
MPPPVWSPYYRPGVRKPDASLNRFAASKAAITGDVSVRRALHAIVFGGSLSANPDT